MPLHVAQLSEYPDFFALAMTLVLTGMTMIFLFHKPSSSVNRYDHDFSFS